jgi:hypothetical protein
MRVRLTESNAMPICVRPWQCSDFVQKAERTHGERQDGDLVALVAKLLRVHLVVVRFRLRIPWRADGKVVQGGELEPGE